MEKNDLLKVQMALAALRLARGQSADIDKHSASLKAVENAVAKVLQGQKKN